MQKYALLIAFEGTRFCGWQRQMAGMSGPQSEMSIQNTIEQAILKMTTEEVSVTGSGRTDAGVHAVGLVCHFVLKNRDWSPDILFRGLNSLLRPAIRVLAVQKVSDEFHAQRDARMKQYSYYFQQGPNPYPHLEPFSWWIRRPLDIEGMQTAVSILVGEHDFKVFQASGAKVKTTVRTIRTAEVSWMPIGFPGSLTPQGQIIHPGAMTESGLVRLRLEGTGFLKQMVRSIAGTLLEVGEGRRSIQDFHDLLTSQDRRKIGMTAPARGLWLERVDYSDLRW
jgi:tRNA pseudouridine38-40 synthase